MKQFKHLDLFLELEPFALLAFCCCVTIERYGFVECAFTLYPLLFHRGDPSLVKLNVAITCGYLLYGECFFFLLTSVCLMYFFSFPWGIKCSRSPVCVLRGASARIGLDWMYIISYKRRRWHMNTQGAPKRATKSNISYMNIFFPLEFELKAYCA